MNKFVITFKALLQIINFILFYLNDIEILTKKNYCPDPYKGPKLKFLCGFSATM